MIRKLDNIWIGMAIGILGAFIGFFLYAIIWSQINYSSVRSFVEDVFLASDLFKDKIITISVLFDVLLFWLCLRVDFLELGKGIIAVLLLSVPLIIYFY